MTDLQKNDVPAVGQVRQSVFIHENSGLRILFAGNSITKHSPRPAMGWLNDCGMAASDEAHDYVHLLLDRIRRYDPNPAWAIAQVGSYEANLWNGAKPSDAHADAAAFGADIIVMFFGANVPKDYETTETPPRRFADRLRRHAPLPRPCGKCRRLPRRGILCPPGARCGEIRRGRAVRRHLGAAR